MVYGTPQTQARRGQLTSDWGYSPDKGYPIHRGRTQNWLPGIFPDVLQADNAEDLPQSHHSNIASHYNIGSRLAGYSVKQDLDDPVPASKHKIVW